MRKCEETCLTKYGVKNPFASDEVKEKIKQQYLEIYGVTHNQQIPEVKEKTLLSKKVTAYNKIKEKFKNEYLPLFSLDEYQGTNKLYKWKCVKCENEFSAKYSNGKLIGRCFKCYPRKRIIISNLEKELVEFCKQYYPNLIENDRQLIKPKELDIVIPELKIAIEFNRRLLA